MIHSKHILFVKSCWIKPDYSYYAVILPIAIICLIQFVIFVMIMIKNFQNAIIRKKYLPSSIDHKSKFNKEILIMLTCFLNSGKSDICIFI